MTVEQLNKANEIFGNIKKLKEFKKEFFCESELNIIVTKYISCSVPRGLIDKNVKLNLDDFPDLKDFISGYLSDKIVELEKQLEEL